MVRLRGFVLVRLLGGLHEMKEMKFLTEEPGRKNAIDASSYYLRNSNAVIRPTSWVLKMILYWY